MQSYSSTQACPPSFSLLPTRSVPPAIFPSANSRPSSCLFVSLSIILLLIIYPLSSLLYIPFSFSSRQTGSSVVRARIPACFPGRDCLVMLTRENAGKEIVVLLGVHVRVKTEKQETGLEKMEAGLLSGAKGAWCGVTVRDVDVRVRNLLNNVNSGNMLEWYGLDEMIRCANG